MNLCKDCKCWGEPVSPSQFGTCFEVTMPVGKSLDIDSIAELDENYEAETVVMLRTKADFGCVLWKTKGV